MAIYDATSFTDAAAPTAVALQPAALGAPYLSASGGLVLVLTVSQPAAAAASDTNRPAAWRAAPYFTAT